jgi:glucokinase
MKKEFCAGVDIGGTKISSALFTREGEIIGKARIPIDEEGGDNAAAQIAGIVGRLKDLAENEGGRLLTIGLCVPGVVYPKTRLVWAPNIPGWSHYPLKDRIAAAAATRTGNLAEDNIPFCVESDRSAYVLGEQWLGAARGAKDAVFLAVGTGIGAGILSGGRLVHGAEDIAGAVGWFALSPDFKDEYAAMGCFEAEASGDSVGRRAVRLLEEGQSSLIRDLAGGDPGRVTAEIVTAAARQGDPVAGRVIAETVSYLAMGIANIVSILNPEIVVLGGGLFRAADLLLDPVRSEFKRWAQPLAAARVRIELSELGEDAGLYGCGKLAWDTFDGGQPCRP